MSSSLTAIFGSTEDKAQDSDKLQNLYWNRAELKKEFADMRREQFKLRDRIKQQEGVSARLQQKLEHLEELLVDPEWVHNVVIYYQFKGFAALCERKLAKFAEQLKQQREQKQHNYLLVRWNDEKLAESRELEEQILLTRNSVQMLEDQLQSERHRLMNMSGFLKIFRRRTLTALLDKLAEEFDNAQRQEQLLAEQLTQVRSRKPPDNSGLDSATKRSINLMILSFAQQLVINLGDHELAALVKEANEKSVGAINYGSRDDCNQLLDRIARRISRMEQATDFADVLRKRAKLLADRAQFRQVDDVVPISASIATLINIDANGLVREDAADVLGENYFGVSKVLSR